MIKQLVNIYQMISSNHQIKNKTDYDTDQIGVAAIEIQTLDSDDVLRRKIDSSMDNSTSAVSNFFQKLVIFRVHRETFLLTGRRHLRLAPELALRKPPPNQTPLSSENNRRRGSTSTKPRLHLISFFFSNLMFFFLFISFLMVLFRLGCANVLLLIEVDHD